MTGRNRDHPPGDVTQWLGEMGAGDRRRSAGELVPLVYDELKKIARHLMRDERMGHTLQTTALVHETYLRLCQQEKLRAGNRREFMAFASQAMRRLLVDHARARDRQKRGGGQAAIALSEVEYFLTDEEVDNYLRLDSALEALQERNPEAAEIVRYRFFVGLSVPETAKILDLSIRTVERRWTVGRAWLRKEIEAARRRGP